MRKLPSGPSTLPCSGSAWTIWTSTSSTSPSATSTAPGARCRASSGTVAFGAIGVSNFHPDRLVDLIEHNEVTPAVDQIETHPFYQRVTDQQVMAERGVQIESWGPFAEGRNNLFAHPVLTEIGAAHGKSVAQVVLRWLVQRGVVVVSKSVRPDRMKENLDVFDFQLTDDQMAHIAALDTSESLFFSHRDPAMVSAIGSRRIHD